MSQISTFWTKIQGCHLTRLVWRTRIIFRFFSYVAIVHLLRRGEYVGIWFRIPLIKSSHKLTRILFIISNSKLGIWLCSQPRIDLNSQSNFYDVLTRPYKYLSNTLPTLSTRTTCTQDNLYISFPTMFECSHREVCDSLHHHICCGGIVLGGSHFFLFGKSLW